MKNKRNKLSKRNASYVKKTLNEFQELVDLGYTHENFINVGQCLNKISHHLFLDELKELEGLWRDSFTDHLENEQLNFVIENINERL